MKKTLFLSAILGAALCSSAFATVDTNITESTTVTVAGYGSLTGTVDLATDTAHQDVITTALPTADITLLTGNNNRYLLKESSYLAKAGTIVLAPATVGETSTKAGQLFLDAAGAGKDITLNNNFIVGSCAYEESGYDGAFRFSAGSHEITLNGNVTLAGQTKFTVQSNSGHSVTINGAVSGSGKMLTIGQGGTLNLNGGGTLGKLYSSSATINFNGAMSFDGISGNNYAIQLESGTINFKGEHEYRLTNNKWLGIKNGAAVTIGTGATLETVRCAYSPSTDTNNGNVTVDNGGTFKVTGTDYSTVGIFTVNGEATIASTDLRVNTLNIGSTGDATFKSITLFEKNSTAGSITVDGTLSLTNSITSLTAAGTGKVNVNSNTMAFTGAGDTAFAGTLNVVAEASTDHGRTVTLNNFAGTVELTGRFGAANCNFGNATKIVLHGDRDNGDTTLASNTTTGFWSNSAQTFSQLIEVKGEHWVDIFASQAYTFNGAVSGNMLRTLNGEAVTFTGTVTLDKFTDKDNAVTFNGNTSIGTLDNSSNKTVTFGTGTTNTLTTLTGAGNVVNNGTIDVVAEDNEAIVARDANGYNDVYRTLTLGGTGTLSGTGTWTLNGAAATLDGHTLSTAAVQDTTEYHIDKADAIYDDSLKAKYVIAEGKKLTASGNTNAIQVKQNNGTLVLDNVTGYFRDGMNEFGNVEIKGTLTMNNGYSLSQYEVDRNIATIANLSGDGTIATTTKGISERTVITGDVSDEISFSNTRNGGNPTFAFTKNVEKVTLKSISNTGSGSLSFEANALEVQSLTLSAGTVGVYAIDSYHHSEHNEADEVSLTTTTLTVSGNANLNADLVIAGNGTMDFTTGHVLTMGSSVTIGEGVKVYISGSADDIRYGQEVTIMESVEEAITLNNAIIFVDGVQQSDFSLKLTDDHRIVVAPEPATATLSLLALAGLMARRRRH